MNCKGGNQRHVARPEGSMYSLPCCNTNHEAKEPVVHVVKRLGLPK